MLPARRETPREAADSQHPEWDCRKENPPLSIGQRNLLRAGGDLWGPAPPKAWRLPEREFQYLANNDQGVILVCRGLQAHRYLRDPTWAVQALLLLRSQIRPPGERSYPVRRFREP